MTLSVEERATLEAGARIIERVASYQSEFCRECDHPRSEHLSEGVGCVSAGGYCDCRSFRVERLKDFTRCGQSFIGFDDMPRQRFWLANGERKQIGSILFANFQTITEAARGDEADGRAIACQQCIRAARRSESNIDRGERL